MICIDLPGQLNLPVQQYTYLHLESFPAELENPHASGPYVYMNASYLTFFGTHLHKLMAGQRRSCPLTVCRVCVLPRLASTTFLRTDARFEFRFGLIAGGIAKRFQFG